MGPEAHERDAERETPGILEIGSKCQQVIAYLIADGIRQGGNSVGERRDRVCLHVGGILLGRAQPSLICLPKQGNDTFLRVVAQGVEHQLGSGVQRHDDISIVRFLCFSIDFLIQIVEKFHDKFHMFSLRIYVFCSKLGCIWIVCRYLPFHFGG